MTTSPDRTAPPAYPGLRLPERIVLQAWMTKHAGEFSRFDHNVALGPGHDPGPLYSDAIRQMSVQNSKRKIDVVAWSPGRPTWSAGRPTLLEIKERATPAAIGQLLTYAHLWEVETGFTGRPGLLIVAARVGPGVIEAANRAGITVEIVTADFSSVSGSVLT